MNRFFYIRLDEQLKMFEGTPGKRIPRNVLLNPKGAPEDWERAIDFLIEEGYLKDFGTYLEITYKGRAFIDNGGFRQQHRAQSVLFYCSIIAALCSLLALVVAVIALVCQING